MDFIELDGVGLRYELSGKGDRTLVLVHEMGGSLESWDDVSPRFGESRRVLRYDTRGAGMSQKVRGQLGIDTMTDDITALLDALVAPDRRAAALERVAKIEAAGMAFAVADSMLNGYAPELRGDIKRFEQYRARWLGNDPASYATIWRMLAGMDMQGELTRLRLPVLVIGGSLDRVRPPALAKAVANAIPGARYIEVPTGHYMAVQTPDLISDCIDEFLRTVGA